MLNNIFYQTVLINDNNIKAYIKKKLMYVP